MDQNNSNTLDPTKLKGKLKAKAICFLLGIGSLFSWNAITNIIDYYHALFPRYHADNVLTLVYPPCALGTMAMFAYYEANINTRRRTLLGYTIFCLGILGLILIDLVTIGRGGSVSFVFICIIIGFFGIAGASVEGGVVGDISFMHPEFIQSFFAGIAASGVLTSMLRLITKVAFDRTDDGLQKGALLFLAISTFFEFTCILLYTFIFPMLPIMKYFHEKAALEGSKTVAADLAIIGVRATVNNVDRLNNKQLLARITDYMLDVFVTYALTLSIFPGLLYKSTHKHQLGSWYPLVMIMIFNICDFASRYIPVMECVKLQSRRSRIGLMIVCFLRVFLIPCFYFATKYGDMGSMIILMTFLGLTHGYLTVCAFTVSSQGFQAPEQNAIGNLLVLTLLAGTSFGVALNWLWIFAKF